MGAATRVLVTDMRRRGRARARGRCLLQMKLVLPAALVLEAAASTAVAPAHVARGGLGLTGWADH